MLRTTALIAGLSLATPLACDGSSDSDDARDLALASIASRIDNTNQRLEALQTKVDETATKVETIAEKTVDRPVPEPEPEAEPVPRPPRRSPDLRDPFAPSDESETDGAPELCARCIEGAEEAIECTESDSCEIACTMDPAFAKSLAADPELLSKQARIVPSTSGGYKLYGIRRGSLPKLLLLRNGDALTEIDGKAIVGLSGLSDALTQFATGKREKVEITVLRKGKPCELIVEAK